MIFEEKNHEIVLLEDTKVEVKINQIFYPGDGKIFFTWLPKPKLKFNIKNVNVQLDNVLQGKTTGVTILKISPLNIQYNAFITNSSCALGKRVELKGNITRPLEINFKKKVSEVFFQLPNFVDFFSSEVLLNTDEFEIKIEALSNIHMIYEELKEKGGYRITHIVCIKKKRSKSFSYKKLTEIQEIIRYFLSFVKGCWTGLILPLERKGKGQILWDIFGIPHIDYWQNVFSWFDGHYLKSIIVLFPEFVKKWKEKVWEEPLKLIIYWYIMSNTQQGGLDGAIIMGQSALELISWTYLVNERKMLSEGGFNDLKTSDCIRIMLSTLEIPIDISKDLENLLKLANKKKWIDGPHAICDIRNDVIHPKKKHSLEIDTNILIDTWKLINWYIEMSLLKILNYDGLYANRLKKRRWNGILDTVPWSKNTC